MAIKYLDMKIPKDIDEAVALNKEKVERQAHRRQCILLSRYDLVINRGKMIVVPIDYEQSERSLPDWAEREYELLK